MAQYTSVKPFDDSSLIDYCFRKLGFPVIQINVDQDQAVDRVNEAFELYYDFHMDATQDVYMPIIVTQMDIDNGYLTTPDGLLFISSLLSYSSAEEVAQASPSTSGSSNIVDVFNMSDLLTGAGLLGGNTQASSNGLGKLSGVIQNDMPMSSMFIAQNYITQINSIFGVSDYSAIPIRFNRNSKELYIDGVELRLGDLFIFEGKKIVNSTAAYNDRWLKDYATSLIKENWAQNMKKFQGIQLPGGVTIDAQTMFDEAKQEQQTLIEELREIYSIPPMPIFG